MNARAQQVFESALELPPQERAAFVERSCGGDEEIRKEVMSLLGAHDEAGDFLQSPTGPVAELPSVLEPSNATTILTDHASIREGPGSRIGPYRIMELIGEGGFGSVFLAEQQSPIERRVALKIIKLGMDTKQIVARFEQERQALALMNHPNIAAVLDAGATESGRPYFVMELVKGEPMTGYCDRYNLSIEDRLRLFVQVCDAVQHAHQKGVIHRDIKPSNVLVSTRDGRPFVKIIDFGIAKAMAGRLTKLTLFTEHHMRVGTPEYMSPEHAEGSLDIDTRSDVYSLGVLLYELLTGETPFDSQELRAAGLGEMQRIIREQEPLNPSRRLSSLSAAGAGPGPGPGAPIAVVAKRRRTDPRSLLRFVRGELDWIVMKCLEKDRGRRYETAKALADDVERHLSNQPVVAGPPSAAYKLRKFVRRHRGGVLAGSLAAGSLVLGLAGTTWAYVEAQRQLVISGQATEAALMSTKQLGDAVSSLAATARGSIAKEAAREPIDGLGRWFEGADLSRVPEVEVEVRQTLSLAYASLGIAGEAEKLLQGDQQDDDSAARARRVLRQAQSILWMANVSGDAVEKQTAAAMAQDAIKMLDKHGQTETSEYAALQVLWGEALVSQNKPSEALPALRNALRIAEAQAPADLGLLGAAQFALSTAEWLSDAPNRPRAQELVAAACDSLSRTDPLNRTKLAEAKGWAAQLHDALNRKDRAGTATMLREADALLKDAPGGRMARVETLNRLGYAYLRPPAEPDTCLEYASEAVRIGQEAIPDGCPKTVQSHYLLAEAIGMLGDEGKQEEQYRIIRRLSQNRPNWLDEAVRNPRSKLAALLEKQGRYREAQEVLAEIVRRDAERGDSRLRLQSTWSLLHVMGVALDPPRKKRGRAQPERKPADPGAIAKSLANERDRLHAWLLIEDASLTLASNSGQDANRDELLSDLRRADQLLVGALEQAPATESADLVADTRTLVDDLCKTWATLDPTTSGAARAEWDRRFAARPVKSRAASEREPD